MTTYTIRFTSDEIRDAVQRDDLSERECEYIACCLGNVFNDRFPDVAWDSLNDGCDHDRAMLPFGFDIWKED